MVGVTGSIPVAPTIIHEGKYSDMVYVRFVYNRVERHFSSKFQIHEIKPLQMA
jgi:hypothetical protein